MSLVLASHSQQFVFMQRFVSRQMRAVLVDWLVDVHHKFKLMPESLFLAIWILDKFLSKQEVERKDLQLVCHSTVFTQSLLSCIFTGNLLLWCPIHCSTSHRHAVRICLGSA
jgi:hypothetical protein